MTRLTVQEAAKRLPELLQEARLGTEITLLEDGQPVAKIVALPYPPPSAPRVPGHAKGQIHMSDDFDDPLPEFADYM